MILREYVWWSYDLYPAFTELKRFLAFWRENLDGALYRVSVVYHALIGPTELWLATGEFRPQ